MIIRNGEEILHIPDLTHKFFFSFTALILRTINIIQYMSNFRSTIKIAWEKNTDV